MATYTGTEGADEYTGTTSKDDINGLGGDDRLYGLAGADFIRGGTGDDYVEGGTSGDGVWGEDGADTLIGGLGDDGLFGGNGADSLIGGEGDDTLASDFLYRDLDSIADRLDGGVGDDTLYAGYNDTVIGGEGLDLLRLYWDAVSEPLTGVLRFPATNGGGTISDVEQIEWTLTAGNDVVRIGDALGDRITLLSGGDGDDVFRAHVAGLSFGGGNGDDRLVVMVDQAVQFGGGEGNDTISYVHADGPIVADLENGVVTRQVDGNTITDRVSVDGIIATRFDDTIVGRNGEFDYDGGQDLYYYVGYGDDRLVGGEGNDVVNGRGGFDFLFGGAGDDVLDGGQQYDEMTGGRGADHFVFQSLRGGSFDYLNPDSGGPRKKPDLITDFSSREGDRIDLSTFDADKITAGRQAPIFIGDNAPSRVAGQMWYTTTNAGLFIHIDRDGDAKSDYDIHLAGKHALAASDFML